MIRAYAPSDLDAIVDIVRKDDMMSAADIQERLDRWSGLVYEDSGVVKGASCYVKEEDGEFLLRMYVDPGFRRQGIGGILCDASVNALQSLGERGRITTKYRIDRGESQQFFRYRGFEYWYSMDYLRYDGPAMPGPDLKPGLEIRPYEDEHFEAFLQVMGDAFIPQRRFFDFRPHDVRELYERGDGRARMLQSRADKFVLLDEGKVAAILELEGGFIDTVGVDFAARGKGYGKALMQFSVNLLRDRGYRTVDTSVVLGNVPAWRLYNVLGFRRVQADEWACKWI